MSSKHEENIDDLITAICCNISGVGPSKGGAVATDFSSNFEEFLEADEQRFAEIKTSSARQILSDEQIKAILKEKEPLIPYTDITEAWMFFIGREFLKGQIDRLNSLQLDSLDINPFLAIALELTTPEEVLKFNLYQSITRSVVTTWGTVVEELLARCGADHFKTNNGGRSGRRPDIRKVKDGKEYLIQVKSGPNTMNVDMVQSLNEVIGEYAKTHPKAKVLLGMTYGRRNMVSTQIKDNLINYEKSSLIGRELWDFITEQKNYHKQIFIVLDASSKGILTTTFTDLMAKKLKQLEKEWKSKYSKKPLHEVLDNYI